MIVSDEDQSSETRLRAALAAAADAHPHADQVARRIGDAAVLQARSLRRRRFLISGTGAVLIASAGLLMSGQLRAGIGGVSRATVGIGAGGSPGAVTVEAGPNLITPPAASPCPSRFTLQDLKAMPYLLDVSVGSARHLASGDTIATVRVLENYRGSVHQEAELVVPAASRVWPTNRTRTYHAGLRLLVAAVVVRTKSGAPLPYVCAAGYARVFSPRLAEIWKASAT